MNITVIYGQQHRGNTWALTKLFLERLKNEDAKITEFYLPEDAPSYCIGCLNCIYKSEKACPHAISVQPIITALDEADLIILSSPCYVLNMTGQLKTLLDHMAYRHMSHRPEPCMFRKQAIAISTAAGTGMGKVTKAIADNLFMWGIARIYRLGIRIGAADFEHIPLRRMRNIERKVNRIVYKIKKNSRRVNARMETKLVFSFMRLGQKHNNWNYVDKEYWQKYGWLSNENPFH